MEHYIKFKRIVWKDDNPSLPEDVIITLDDKTYNDFISDDMRVAYETAGKVLIGIEETYKAGIATVRDGWSSWEFDAVTAP